MPLKLGTWHCNINGAEGTLFITNLDATGSVTATLQNPLWNNMNNKVIGLWDETSRKFSFTTEFQAEPAQVQPLFEAIVFSTPLVLEPGRDIVWTMVGFFHVVDQNVLIANGGNARRHTFGWFANSTEVS